MDKIFAKTLKTLFWNFSSSPSQANLMIFSKTEIRLFLLYDEKLYGERKQKKLMIRRSCIADKWKNK